MPFEVAGLPAPLLRRVPPLLLRLAALTNATVRELLEMQYQFEEPFIVDSSKITTLGVTATLIDRALADTLAAYHRGPTPTSHPRPPEPAGHH